LRAILVKFSAWKSVRYRNLNSFGIESVMQAVKTDEESWAAIIGRTSLSTGRIVGNTIALGVGLAVRVFFT
jgi:hypothetical protein